MQTIAEKKELFENLKNSLPENNVFQAQIQEHLDLTESHLMRIGEAHMEEL